MKTYIHIPCALITSIALLSSKNSADANVGATTPFISYEGEAGTLGGGLDCLLDRSAYHAVLKPAA